MRLQGIATKLHKLLLSNKKSWIANDVTIRQKSEILWAKIHLKVWAI